MNKINSLFNNKKNEKLLSLYFCAGCPTLEGTADVILAMKDGAVVERGTHEELVAKRGFYYDLYMNQFPTATHGRCIPESRLNTLTSATRTRREALGPRSLARTA